MSSALGLAAVPALLAIGFVMPFVTGTPIVHLLLPFLAPLLPLSVGYALIRHNVLATAAVLTRRMFIVPVLTGGFVAAIIAWLALRAVDARCRFGEGSFPGSARRSRCWC